MKKSYILLAITLVIVAIYFFINNPESRVCFTNKCVNVQIVNTPSERAKGLMFIESLGEDEGMLFTFDSSEIHSFWMKNTLIPLDIIWIDENFKVVHIENAVPCESDPCPSYVPEKEAKYVLEVNSGFVEENGVGVGDRATFS